MSDKLLEIKKNERIKKFTEKRKIIENEEREESDTIPQNIMVLLKAE